MTHGHVVDIFIAPVSEAPLQRVEHVRAVSGMGLEGDRYFNRAAAVPGIDPLKAAGQQATLIESEAIEAIDRENGICLQSGQSRRNIVTRGIALNHFVGKEFRVGDVVMRGIRLCEPCGHLEKMTRTGVRAALVHRGGLRAQILSEGVIRTGDRIEALQHAEVRA